MSLLAAVDRRMGGVLDGSFRGRAFIYPSSRDIDFRPNPTKRVTACVDVSLRDQEIDVFSDAPIEPRDWFGCCNPLLAF